MTTPRKTDMQKTRGAFARAFTQTGQAIPALLRTNWRNIVMPWRMLPHPVALALIGLVALAMVLDMGEEPVSTIGSTAVPSTLDCAEDTVIAFTGVDTLACVHFENIPASYGTVTLTLGDYVPGESPCAEDEIYDTVAVECVHIDRVAPRHTAQPGG